MKKRVTLFAAAGIVLSLTTGCTIVGVSEYEHDDIGYYEDEYEVDAYVSLPYGVRMLIADCVDGYAMPPVSRYGEEIYPVNYRERDNLPSFICADFNGDYEDDYALMFSRIRWTGDMWRVKTKLLVVTSTRRGYELSAEIQLGEVVGSAEEPLEEYWGIRLLEPGRHSVTWYDDEATVEERVYLSDYGIYLASIDPSERSVFYVERGEVVEVRMDMGAVAKKQVSATNTRASRVISLAKESAGTAAVQ